MNEKERKEEKEEVRVVIRKEVRREEKSFYFFSCANWKQKQCMPIQMLSVDMVSMSNGTQPIVELMQCTKSVNKLTDWKRDRENEKDSCKWHIYLTLNLCSTSKTAYESKGIFNMHACKHMNVNVNIMFVCITVPWCCEGIHRYSFRIDFGIECKLRAFFNRSECQAWKAMKASISLLKYHRAYTIEGNIPFKVWNWNLRMNAFYMSTNKSVNERISGESSKRRVLLQFHAKCSNAFCGSDCYQTRIGWLVLLFFVFFSTTCWVENVNILEESRTFHIYNLLFVHSIFRTFIFIDT